MDPLDSTLGDPFVLRTPDTSFGDGVAEDLPEVLTRRGFERPLIVTDEGVLEAGVAETALDRLDGDPPVYHAVTEPSTTDFDDLESFDVDAVVALGGGSVLDTAKLLSLLLAHGGEPSDYIGVGSVPGPTIPLVAVPTTSGTGSQATQTVVLTHEGVKRGISDEYLRPDVALVDPSLTVGLPRTITARSGFDAFVHALESLTARDYRWVPERPISYQGANPVSRPLSRRALRLVAGSLERAAFDGTDREARRAMSLGAHLAGVAFSNAGLGAVHALASTIGGMTGRPHGECLAAAFRVGLEYNRPVRESEYAAIARDLGLVGTGATDEVAADALVEEGQRLATHLGLPDSLSAVGFDSSDLDALVENTLVQERRLVTNPRQVTDDVGDHLAEYL